MEPHLIALTCKTGSVAVAVVALVAVARVTVTMATVVWETIIFCNFFNSIHTLLLCPSLKRVFAQSKREREGGSEGRTFFSFFRFIRSLTNFFKPSCHQFSSIVYSLTNSKRYSSVGLQLIKYLSKMEGVREREREREGSDYCIIIIIILRSVLDCCKV